MYNQKGEYIPKSKRESYNRKYLFDMQSILIEHKFPLDHIAEHEYQISNAGDIFRSLTESSPDPGYFGRKVDSLVHYFKSDNTGDFLEYRELMKSNTYKKSRDKYMKNLMELRRLTETAYIDPRRKEAMLSGLDLIKEIILWFESGNPHRPPTLTMNKLIDNLESFIPGPIYERV